MCRESWFNYLYLDDDDYVGTARRLEIVKLLNVDANENNAVPDTGNYIIFRLANTILLYAEALSNLGEGNDTLREVNRIRQRAGAPDFIDANNLDASVYWEHVCESMGEGQHFYDLVRTQKVCDADLAVFTNKSGHREKKVDLKQDSWTWSIYRKALNNNPYMTKNLCWE